MNPALRDRPLNDRATPLSWGALAALCPALAWFTAPALIDDAYITLAYARNLGAEGFFGLFEGALPYTFTSPLNLALTAIVGIVVGFDQAIPIKATLELWLLLWLCARTSRLLFGAIAPGQILFALLALNPLVLSSFGMESNLGLVLLLAALNAAIARQRLMFGGALGLLVLVRPEFGVLLLAAPLLWLPDPRRLAARPLGLWGRVYGAAACPIVVWHLFAWFRLGSAIPLTLFIKTEQSFPGWTYPEGYARFLEAFPLAAIVALLGLGVVLFGGSGQPTRRAGALSLRLALVGVLLLGALALLRVPAYHWYFIQPLALFLIASWVQFAARLQSPRAARQRAWALGMFGLVALAATATSSLRAGRLAEAPIHTNWASRSTYEEIGAWLGDNLPPAEHIGLRGEIGTLQYFAGEVRLVDPFSDPRWLEDRQASGSRSAPFLEELNFRHQPPLEALPKPRLCLSSQEPPSGPPDAIPYAVARWPIASRWSSPRELVLRDCDD